MAKFHLGNFFPKFLWWRHGLDLWWALSNQACHGLKGFRRISKPWIWMGIQTKTTGFECFSFSDGYLGTFPQIHDSLSHLSWRNSKQAEMFSPDSPGEQNEILVSSRDPEKPAEVQNQFLIHFLYGLDGSQAAWIPIIRLRIRNFFFPARGVSWDELKWWGHCHWNCLDVALGDRFGVILKVSPNFSGILWFWALWDVWRWQ